MAQTREKTIAGLTFKISAPYEAGHTITEAEAKALNQVRSENIGNNLRDVVKKAVEAGKPESEIAAAVAQYDTEYVFNLAAVSQAAKYTPEEKEARKIARELVGYKLAEKGLGFKKPAEGITQEDWDAKIEENISRFAADPKVIAKANKRIAERAKVKAEFADELNL